MAPDHADMDLSEDDLTGQLQQLADEFSLSPSQTEAVRDELESLIDERTEGAALDEGEKELMVHLMASVVRQSLDQPSSGEAEIIQHARLCDLDLFS